MKQPILRAALGAAFVCLWSAAAHAQEPLHAHRYRIDLGLGGGNGEHRTDGSNLDDRTDAGFFRLGFEGIGSSGFGGGARLEAWATDDNLFGTATEASASNLFAHLTWRDVGERHTLPVRFGLLFNSYVLTDNNLNVDATAGSLGLLAEVAPEFVLSGNDSFAWSVLGTLSLGVAATAIDVDGVGDDFRSDTRFFGFELGTRLRFSAFDLGLSYVHRRQSMDRSDVRNSVFVFGFDGEFDGVVLSLGYSW